MLQNFSLHSRARAPRRPLAPQSALIAVVIAAMLPAAAPLGAGSPIASVSPQGAVRLGETPSPIAAGQPLSAGEAIETGRDGLAAIRTWNDGRLELRSDSRARLFEDRLDLETGAAASAGLPISLDDVTIAPEGAGEHWFAVGARDGRTMVAAHKGPVVIRRSGARSIVVPAGSYAFPSPKTAKNDDDDDDDRKPVAGASGRTAQPPAANSSGGWTVGSLSHGQSMLLVGGISAVAATGVVAGVVVANDSQPARSPSQ